MKVKSKKLRQYLEERNAFNSTPEEFISLKQQYRKEYKREWANNRLPHHELRPALTLKEYSDIKKMARESGYKNPTAFTKNLILSSLQGKPIAPDRDLLLTISQKVGMSINLLKNPYTFLDKSELIKFLTEAENILLEYIRKY